MDRSGDSCWIGIRNMKNDIFYLEFSAHLLEVGDVLRSLSLDNLVPGETSRGFKIWDRVGARVSPYCWLGCLDSLELRAHQLGVRIERGGAYVGQLAVGSRYWEGD